MTDDGLYINVPKTSLGSALVSCLIRPNIVQMLQYFSLPLFAEMKFYMEV